MMATETISSCHQANLIGIPAECFVRIVEFSSPQDVAQLRLVCSEAESKVHMHFAKVYFSKRKSLLCSLASLRTLLAIAEHRIFSKTLMTVIFAGDQITDVGTPATHPNPVHGRVVDIFRGFVGPKALPQTEQEMKDWALLKDRQDEMQTRNYDLRLLTMIFARFRKSGNVPEIQILNHNQGLHDTSVPLDYHSKGEEHLRVKHAQELERACGMELDPSSCGARPVSIVLEAFALSALSIKKLTVRVNKFEWLWSWHDLIFNSTLAHTRAVFHGLEELDLQPHWRDKNVEGNHDAAVKLLELIASAPRLRKLYVGFPDWSCHWQTESTGRDQFLCQQILELTLTI